MQIGGGFNMGGGLVIYAPSSSLLTVAPSSVDYLVVAGGGGGGHTVGGGGGAGGLLTGTTTVSAGTSYTVTVGTGGAGGVIGDYTQGSGTSGANSVFYNMTAIGGGGGGNFDNVTNNVKSGGSGGGAGGGTAGGAGTGTTGQGNAGGATAGNNNVGGGGGGAGAVGTAGAVNSGGTGGDGSVTTIFGSNLGSVSFNGTSQYLSAPNSAALQLGSNNFAIETWVYPTGTNSDSGIFYINGNGIGFAAVRVGWIYNGGSPQIYLLVSQNGSSWAIVSGVISGGPALNTWTHVALVRNGTAFTLYQNGVSIYTTTLSGALQAGTSNLIGAYQYSSPPFFYFPGYISNFRIVNGNAVYTGNFTPSTSPLSATQSASTNTNAVTAGQTALLLNMPYGSGYLTDSSANNFTITNTGAAVSAPTNPFYIIAYAGGGGGGARSGTYTGIAPPGGQGGGGTGGIAVAGTAGTPNTGGGGGGGGYTGTQFPGGAGGAGIVVIAYPNTYADITSFASGFVVNGVTTTGSNVPASDTVSRTGYKIYKFTSGTGTITF